MCGIFGILSDKPVAIELYEGLVQMQHRGQDMAGIMTCDSRMHLKVGPGQVGQVFNKSDLEELTGHFGIAHLRYPTHGTLSLNEAQPLVTSFPYGMGLVHNGNLTNYEKLKKFLIQERRYINTHSDSELLINSFADQLAKFPPTTDDLTLFDHFCSSINYLFKLVNGAYSVIVSIIDVGLIAFRDPHGIRPLIMGERDNGDKKDYCFASENTAFRNLGFEYSGDVAPGEVVFVNTRGKIYRKVVTQKEFHPCMFEYVYFARPDAVLNQLSVYRARYQMGEKLAHNWQQKYPDLKPDVVIPVPFTSNTAALAFANTLGARYCEGLYKNTFVGRTFIMPNQEKRVKAVRAKLSPHVSEIKGKQVLLIDDSIVRGTTSKEIVKIVREAGAEKVYLLSCCPPIKFPCYYGIDIPTKNELVFNQCLTEEGIAKELGVDILLYQDIEDLKEAIVNQLQAPKTEKLCMACLNGNYCCGKSE